MNFIWHQKNYQNFQSCLQFLQILNFPNYGLFNKRKKIEKTQSPFQVDYVDGFAMLLNKNKFKDNIYFDENFFLYLENNDLCLRVNKTGGSVFRCSKGKNKSWWS